MDIDALKEQIIKTLDDKKAIDIEVLEVKDKTILADYFIVASGSSNTQVKALCDDVIYQVEKNLGITPVRKESDERNRWNLLDYQDIIVHVFLQEEREFYQIEKLWRGPMKKDSVDS